MRFSEWYHPVIGLISGAAILVFAVLPGEYAGLGLVVAAVLAAVVSLIARRVPPRATAPARWRASRVIWLIVLTAVLAVCLVLVWTVVRETAAYWLAGVLAIILFLTASAGAWFDTAA